MPLYDLNHKLAAPIRKRTLRLNTKNGRKKERGDIEQHSKCFYYRSHEFALISQTK